MSSRDSSMGTKMRIALLGTRGIPARYSGFETFYENLATRLVQRGHEVTVYNRSNYYTEHPKDYKGVRIVNIATIQQKHLDTFYHTLVSTIHACAGSYDVLFYCIVGNSPITALARLSGACTMLSVDGADWQRAKWGRFARWYLRMCERIACHIPHLIIADSPAIRERYQREYQQETVYIPYGANISGSADVSVLERFGLEQDKYVLFVGRLVPENDAHVLIEAFRQIQSDLKLVIVGDAPFAQAYKKDLRAVADDRVVFTGYLFDDDYAGISSHCRLFVLPSGIQGTRPVLLDQLGFGNCVLARDVPATRAVVADSAVLFSTEPGELGLVRQLQHLLNDYGLITRKRSEARAHVSRNFSWEVVTDAYEMLFLRAMHQHRTMVSGLVDVFDVFEEAKLRAAG
jgi:glycosyltransferase involved in cell wall biosynthesis